MTSNRQALLPGFAPASTVKRRPAKRRHLAAILGARWEVLADPDARPGRAFLIAYDDFALVFDARLDERGWSLWDGRGDTIGHGFDFPTLAAELRRFVGESAPASVAQSFSPATLAAMRRELER
jgi:hypothetical protein